VFGTVATTPTRSKTTVKVSATKKAKPTKKASPKILDRSAEILNRLKDIYGAPICELTHENPFQLLSATILSAQCTDARVNMVTPALFAEFPTAQKMAIADVARVEELVRSTGFYATKAKNLVGMARNVMERFDGEVPSAIEDLVTLPGVGRKTANVLRSVVFDLPGLPVDTHVGRLSRRLGLTNEEDPVKVEYELNAMFDPKDWGGFSLRLILHGRRVCDAKKPKCDVCELADICPSSEMPYGKLKKTKKAK
jgi:endonuclease-3